MNPQIIVCGLGRAGYKILCLLQQQGVNVVGIHHAPISNTMAEVIVGDAKSAETLLAAGIREAQTLVLTDAEDGANLAVLMQARVLNPQIRIVNRLFNQSLGDRLDQTLPDHISMSVAALSAPIFAFAALGDAAIGQLRLFDQIWPIHEAIIDADHPWCGLLLSDLWDDRSRMLIYYLPLDQKVDLITALLQGERLKVGDRLIIGTQPSVRIHRKSLTRWLMRWGVGLKYLRQHSRLLLLATVFVLMMILGSTLTYMSSVLQTSWVDALYFSVGIITGAGGNDIGLANAPNSLKFFTVTIMLVGAAIVGLSYALLNDFVLGTRFDHVQEATWIPQRRHFIVCGLGGVGIQIVQHLVSYGHEVVVIEQDPDCRFLSTARSLKVPVIRGDARLPATLQGANFTCAQTLLAVTSNDVANLEIALNAKSLNPKVGVVVRYQDPHFAQMAKQVFEFDAVLSPAELVAPAFAAAALGGRILGNGMAGNSLWVALATLITPGHPFCGDRVQEAAVRSDFVPLYAETQTSDRIHGWELLQHQLSAGDVLYLTMPGSQLELLWQTLPSRFMREKMRRQG
jgi:Trk K+ transport system NAD-binding subunit